LLLKKQQLITRLL